MVDQRDNSGAQPLLANASEDQNAEGSPFTLLRSLIRPSIKAMAIPGTIIRLRHYCMALNVVAVVISIYEILRYSVPFGPLPQGELYVLLWNIGIVSGSIVSLVGSFLLNKGLILAGCLLLCCVMAPITPNMIVLTQGDQYEYFIGLTLFYFLAGMLMCFLFANLAEELQAREALNGQPNQLGSFPKGLVAETTQYGPCECSVSPMLEKDDDFLQAINADDGAADIETRQKMCPKCYNRVKYLAENPN